MKNDALKKHHFWILAGAGLLFSLLAFLMVMVNVSAAVSKEKAELDKQYDAVKGNSPKGTKALEDMDKQKEVLEARKKDLWKANYEQQKSLFAWPNQASSQAKLKPLEERFTKFGEPIPRNPQMDDALELFKTREVYETAYDRLADSIKPTSFPGRDWRKVLRHVTAWGDVVPTANRVWLSLEDLWVQKTLLLAVNDINAANRNFTPVSDDKAAPPLKRKFRNRIWDIELEVPTSGKLDHRAFLVKLTNRTDRMQVLGMNKTMTLRVWVNDSDFPVLLRFQKEFVKAHATFEIREKVDITPPADRKALMDQGLLDEVQVQMPGPQTIPPGVEVTKIRKVEQVLDDLNVPVRQVLDIVLGYKDARHAAAALKPPAWWPADAAAPADGAAPASGFGAEAGDAGGPGGGRGSMMMGAGGGGGGGRGSKTGGPAAVLDSNRNRYVEVTNQVRRMPVAVVLLVDQMFMQDALVAYANSPLRLQITQFHWKRFRGNLSSTTAAGAAGGYGGDGGEGGDAGPSGGGEGGAPAGGGKRGMGMSMGAGVGGESVGGPSLPGGSPDGGEGGFGSGLMGGGYGGMSGFGSASSAAADAQVTSGLVELTIYGIVTLYEKYPDPPAAGTPGTGSTPDAATPATTTPPAGQPTTPATPPADGTEPKAPAAPATPPAGGTPDKK